MENNSCSSQYVSFLQKNYLKKKLNFSSAATYVLGNVEEIAAEDWSRVFDVNVRGYALMAKHIGPIMKKQNMDQLLIWLVFRD